MAQSGTRTFGLTHLQLITEALRLARTIDYDTTPSANHKTIATRYLNLLMAEWANRGVYLWSLENKEITIVADQVSYTSSIDQTYWTVDTVGHFWRNSSGVDTEVEVIALNEYQKISDKDETGSIQKICFIPTSTGYHTLYVYPVPSATVGTGTLHVQLLKKLQDFTNENDDPDFTPNWYMAVAYGLAVPLAQVDGAHLDTLQYLRQEAAIKFNAAFFGHVHKEEGDIQFVPGFYKWGRDFYR